MKRDSLLFAAPPLLFVVGAGVLTTGIVRYAGQALDSAVGAAAIAVLAAYLLWLILEVPVTFRRSAVPPADSRTLLPYALARLCLVTSAAVGPLPWTRWSPMLIIPVVLFALGVAIRHLAIRTLGRFYSHHVMRQDGHQVVTHGPYRVIRHPAYAGMLLAHIGFTAFFLNPVSMVAFVLLAAAVIYRILVEEGPLWVIPGYPDYAIGRARLLPGVW
jgi:protein-S-isoprenylcysteine O-methyltransferase Ste14